MAESTSIEWADSTFNPWIGCIKVSPGCDHCYAEALMDKRYGKVQWGPHGERVRTSPGNWQHPRRWQRQAAAFFAEHGRRRRVFCASLADVFDNAAPEGARDDLWQLIRETPDLDWMLLTKRPQNIHKMLPDFWPDINCNTWLGTSTENQAEADRRLMHLLGIHPRPAVFFASAEPLLERIDYGTWLPGCFECADECGWRSGNPPKEEICFHCGIIGENRDEFCSRCRRQCFGYICPRCDSNVVQHHPDTPVLDWIIAGGESGASARPSHPDWMRSIRDQCAAAGVPFLFKQWGEFEIAIDREIEDPDWRADYSYKLDHRGKNVWLNLAGGMGFHGERFHVMRRVGKERAGRMLDGVTHDAFPQARR